MEINRIWAYIDAKKRLLRAKENLEEYEGSVYSPSSANMNGMPIEHTNTSPDRFAIIAETHSQLTEAKDCAMVDATREYNLLLAFEYTLSDEEREVFRMRYIRNMTIRESGRELHRSEATLKRINKRIKEKFKKFEIDTHLILE